VAEDQLEALTDPNRSPVERLHTGLSIVADLVGEEPSVLVFEDLHWADSESAALFERIADHDGPRLLIGTYRPDEVTRRHPIAGLLARMERRHSITHLRLGRLSPPQTAAMLAAATGRPAPVRAADSLHQRTGGNPFFWRSFFVAATATTSKSCARSHSHGAWWRCCGGRLTTSNRCLSGWWKRRRCSDIASRSIYWRALPRSTRASWSTSCAT
jgi:hypothetical protein